MLTNNGHQVETAVNDLVVGAAAHYSWEQIEPWVVSLERSGYTGQRAVIAYNLAPDVIGRLTTRGFYIKHVVRQDRLIHVDRFFLLWQLLHEVEARYVIATDTGDLVFQTNPSTWLEEHLHPFCLNVGSESLAHKDQDFNDQGMLAAFGPDVCSWMKEKTVYNAGSVAGEAGSLRDLSLNIYLMCFQNAYSNADQFALNVLINLSPWKEITRFNSMADGWACQVGTVADPSRMNTFRPHLKESEPVFKTNGFIYPAGSATPFCIVHQYDRNPVWESSIRNRYRD
jgi:hypothetical protein